MKRLISLGYDPGTTKRSPSTWVLADHSGIRPRIIDYGDIWLEGKDLSDFIEELEQAAHRIASHGPVSIAVIENQYFGKIKKKAKVKIGANGPVKSSESGYILSSVAKLIACRGYIVSSILRIVRPEQIILPYPAEWWKVGIPCNHARNRSESKAISCASFEMHYGFTKETAPKGYNVGKNDNLADAANMSVYGASIFRYKTATQ